MNRQYSPVVGQEQLDMVRRSLDLWNRGDLEGLVADFEPETEYVVAESFVSARTLRGPQEVASYLQDWRETVHGLRYEIVKLVEGEGLITTIGKLSGRAGAPDGPEITADLCFVTRFVGRGSCAWRSTSSRRKRSKPPAWPSSLGTPVARAV
jgi:ketosteroid isomerase-like protein